MCLRAYYQKCARRSALQGVYISYIIMNDISTKVVTQIEYIQHKMINLIISEFISIRSDRKEMHSLVSVEKVRHFFS